MHLHTYLNVGKNVNTCVLFQQPQEIISRPLSTQSFHCICGYSEAPFKKKTNKKKKKKKKSDMQAMTGPCTFSFIHYSISDGLTSAFIKFTIPTLIKL